ncbi:hypothetical protein B0I35DRAFT_464917 [Stachybotrys elegans]|uniref:Uncharacterized protein n=1 Tax=Stachybotrys elegans TaxID=80388 RepID=A0A8K0SGJ8_9HYPO|nr:hypothetical protein B0I35DRAFT_464917 [Stachybotrys elegans]
MKGHLDNCFSLQRANNMDTQGYNPQKAHPAEAVLSPKAYSRWGQLKHLLKTEVSWRLAMGLCFTMLLITVLHSFARLGELGSWNRRLFNTLTILLTSLMSMSLGSLCTFLGAMIRWPLLAGKSHSASDADIVLRMHTLAGSATLIWRHFKAWSLDKSTFVITAYLLLNVGVRFSVAGFGLTFELQETPGVNFPAMTPDWTSREWFPIEPALVERLYGAPDSPKLPQVQQINMSRTMDSGGRLPDMPGDLMSQARDLRQFASLGLLLQPLDFDIETPSNFNRNNLSRAGIDRKVNGKTVTYSYSLREFISAEEYISRENVIYSSSTCQTWFVDGIVVFDSNMKMLGNLLLGNLSNPIGKDAEVLRELSHYVTGWELDLALAIRWDVRDNWRTFSDPSGCAKTYRRASSLSDVLENPEQARLKVCREKPSSLLDYDMIDISFQMQICSDAIVDSPMNLTAAGEVTTAKDPHTAMPFSGYGWPLETADGMENRINF